MKLSDAKPGTLVHLKSGGPIMTVQNVVDDSKYGDLNCAWFHNGESCCDVFWSATLEEMEFVAEDVFGPDGYRRKEASE